MPCAGWPCLPPRSPVPPSPSSSESIHTGFSQFFNTPHVPFCQGTCTMLFFLFLFFFSSDSSSLFWIIYFCSTLRSQFKCHLLKKSSQITTPLPPLPKSGQVPLYSAFRDCIPFHGALSLVNYDILLRVIVLFICLPLCAISSKRASVCSPFHSQCLKMGLAFERSTRNTCWLNKWMVRLQSNFIFSCAYLVFFTLQWSCDSLIIKRKS